MRETSRQAFRELKATGQLGAKQEAALDALSKHGPCTASELSTASGIHGLWRRMSELDKLGLVRTAPNPRRCSVSGKLAIVWISLKPKNYGSQAELF